MTIYIYRNKAGKVVKTISTDGGGMFETGEASIDANEEAIKELEKGMSPAAIAFGKQMAEEMADNDEEIIYIDDYEK